MVNVTMIAFCMIVCVVAVSECGAGNIKINDAPEEVKLSKVQEEMEEFQHKTTVHHFARHGLCAHIQGKMKFFKALQKHFIGISDHMRVNFIMDICSHKDEMLDLWVKEIFDMDGDGYISHFEKGLYDHIN
ncbi:uncharacterized protein LOC127863690 [Dreissena polymorpha]|nr:uncharacterized protein LOC127863690 [Dreissena polymorpha]